MQAANENIRGAVYDDPAWSIMEAAPGQWYSLNKSLKMLLPAWFIEEGQGRNLKNFLWFVKFEHSYKQDEINRRREKMEIVK